MQPTVLGLSPTLNWLLADASSPELSHDASEATAVGPHPGSLRQYEPIDPYLRRGLEPVRTASVSALLTFPGARPCCAMDLRISPQASSVRWLRSFIWW